MKELVLSQVGVNYGAVRALDDVSVRFRAGRIMSVVGPNGAGKSTLLDVASGLRRPSSGRVLADDEPLPQRRPHHVALSGIRRSFQTSRVMPARTVYENVLLGASGSASGHFFQDVFATPARRKREAALREAVRDAINTVGLADDAENLAGSLSYGRLRLMEVARAIVGEPDLVLLDEPAAGLNTREADRLGDLLQELVAQRGMGIVLIEHNLGLVRRLSEEMYVLNFGCLIAGGRPAEVVKDPAVVAAYTGGAI